MTTNNEMFTQQGNSIVIDIFKMIIVALGAGWAAVKLFGKKKIDTYFDKKLKKYQHDLDLITQKAQFDYSRMNQDFNLWTTKRHEAYAKIYASIDEILRKLSQIKDVEYLEFHSKENFIRLLQKENVSNFEIDEVILLLEGNPENAIKAANRAIRFAKLSKANICIIKTQTVFGENILYLSCEIYKMVEEFLSKTSTICGYYGFDNLPDSSKLNMDKLIQDINKLSPKIIELMRKELSGDYRFTPNNGSNQEE